MRKRIVRQGALRDDRWFSTFSSSLRRDSLKRLTPSIEQAAIRIAANQNVLSPNNRELSGELI